MSLAFIARAMLPQSPSVALNEAVWMSCAAIEGFRLGLTVMLHRTVLGSLDSKRDT